MLKEIASDSGHQTLSNFADLKFQMDQTFRMEESQLENPPECLAGEADTKIDIEFQEFTLLDDEAAKPLLNIKTEFDALVKEELIINEREDCEEKIDYCM